MPLVGENSAVITWLRVVADSAPLEFSSQAAVSVNDAPAPMNCWYVVFSLTVTLWLPAALVLANEMADCCCRPRVTLRPPESFVVVSQMLTVSAAALAKRSGRSTSPAARTAAAPSTRYRIRRMTGPPLTWTESQRKDSTPLRLMSIPRFLRRSRFVGVDLGECDQKLSLRLLLTRR